MNSTRVSAASSPSYSMTSSSTKTKMLSDSSRPKGKEHFVFNHAAFGQVSSDYISANFCYSNLTVIVWLVWLLHNNPCTNCLQLYLPNFFATALSCFASMRPTPISSSSNSSRTWAASCKTLHKIIKQFISSTQKRVGWWDSVFYSFGRLHYYTPTLLFTPFDKVVSLSSFITIKACFSERHLCTF